MWIPLGHSGAHARPCYACDPELAIGADTGSCPVCEDSSYPVEAVSRRLALYPGIEIVQGELAIVRGQMKKGIILLEKGLDAVHKFPGASFYLGSETLARAYEKQGNFEAALRVLKRAPDAKWKAAFSCLLWEEMNGPWWLRDELELADLYRKMAAFRKPKTWKTTLEDAGLRRRRPPHRPRVAETRAPSHDKFFRVVELTSGNDRSVPYRARILTVGVHLKSPCPILCPP